MNALDAYLSERGIDDATFAARIDLSRASVSRLRRGKQAFTSDVLQRIAAATNYELTPNLLLSTPAPSPVEAAP